VLGTCQTRLD